MKIMSITGKTLFETEAVTTKEALIAAVRSGANLSGAYLSRADLSGADLSGADLSGANLSRANGISKYSTTPLYVLLDQPWKIRAYKLVNENYESPIQANGKIKYEIGKDYEVVPDTNELRECAAGINVATMDWCLKEWRMGYHVLIVEFEAEDIACIPIGSNGKFRLSRCTVVAEKDMSDILPKERKQQ